MTDKITKIDSDTIEVETTSKRRYNRRVLERRKVLLAEQLEKVNNQLEALGEEEK